MLTAYVPVPPVPFVLAVPNGRMVVPSALDADMLFGDAGTDTVTAPLVTVWEAPLML